MVILSVVLKTEIIDIHTGQYKLIFDTRKNYYPVNMIYSFPDGKVVTDHYDIINIWK